jgi:hypothetical protein
MDWRNGLGVMVCLAACAVAPKVDRPIDEAQREYDRTTGRVEGRSSYELGRIQSPPRTEWERVQRNLDRQELIERQTRAEGRDAEGVRAPESRPRQGPAVREGAYLVSEPDKEALKAEVLEVVVAYERGTREAERELAGDPAELRDRRRALAVEMEVRLARIMTRYSVRRVGLPTTRAVPP